MFQCCLLSSPGSLSREAPAGIEPAYAALQAPPKRTAEACRACSDALSCAQLHPNPPRWGHGSGHGCQRHVKPLMRFRPLLVGTCPQTRPAGAARPRAAACGAGSAASSSSADGPCRTGPRRGVQLRDRRRAKAWRRRSPRQATPARRERDGGRRGARSGGSPAAPAVPIAGWRADELGGEGREKGGSSGHSPGHTARDPARQAKVQRLIHPLPPPRSNSSMASRR